MKPKIKRTIKMVHTVEYEIEASDDPGSPRGYWEDGIEPKTAEQVIDRVIECIKFNNKNPTTLVGQYGAHYVLKEKGKDGNRTTLITVSDDL